MHDMQVFCPIKEGSLTRDEKKKALLLLMSVHVHWRAQAERRDLVKHYVPNGGNGISIYHRRNQCTRGAQRCLLQGPRGLMHADIKEDITMMLKGRLAELMVQVALNLYRK